jgi:hypothetical protein
MTLGLIMKISSTTQVPTRALLCLAFVFPLLMFPVHASSSAAQDSTDDVFISDTKLERVSVKWIAPKSFRDVRASSSSNSKFRKHVFSQLEKHLDELAKDLPKGQFLRLSVTNVDLAGRVEPASFIGLSNTMDDIRVMRDIDIPRLSFTYELLDANGDILKREDVVLKNMNYLHDIHISFRNRPFEHEKKMLSEWFTSTFLNEK